MYDFLEGKIERMNPTEIVVNINGVGYQVHISLNTFEEIKHKESLKIYTHLVVREDSHSLYGFANTEERDLFLKLIAVNGVGTATARMILSALTVQEVVSAITNSNIAMLKSVKGIGPKAAQRLIVELQDKMGNIGGDLLSGTGTDHSAMEEAVEALVALGFSRPLVQKTVLKISKSEGNNLATEELIKKSLQIL